MRLLSQSEASIQKRTSTAKFARSPCTDPQVPEAALEDDEQTVALMTAANQFCIPSLVERCTKALG